MLLRESGRVLNQSVDLEAVVDVSSSVDDYGFPGGVELMAFATAANRAANPAAVPVADLAGLQAILSDSRRRLSAAMGPEALIEAAATVAIFNGLVRVADGTGIELDDGMIRASVDVRAELKLDELSGAANTRRLDVGLDDVQPGPIHSVASLFADSD